MSHKQTTRTRKHIKFMKLVKRTARTLRGAWTTPFSPSSYGGYYVACKRQDSMPLKWQQRIDASLNTALAAYHKVESDGYSQADRDAWYLNH